MRIALYTCLYGDSEPLHEDVFGGVDGVDRFLFTDNPKCRLADTETVVDPLNGLDPARASRRAKLMPHRYLRDYEYSIYLDNRARLLRDPIKIVKDAFLPTSIIGTWLRPRRSFWAFRHPHRDCIYDEAVVCAEAAMDRKESIENQMSVYRQEGFPKHFGLIAGTILVRNHGDEKLAELGERWFEQVLEGSKRDQLSFNYLCWKLGFRWSRLPGGLLRNKIIQWPVWDRVAVKR
jgi:hypothetical protein